MFSKAEAERLKKRAFLNASGAATGASAEATKSKKKTGGRIPSLEGDQRLEQEAVELTFEVTPEPKHRPRTFVDEASLRKAFTLARGRVDVFMKNIRMKTVTSKSTKAFEKNVAQIASLKMGARPPLVGPVAIEITFFLAGDDMEFPVAQRDGDLDNHEKSTLDALNGILYTDDRMIVQKNSRKVCTSGKPRIEIRAWPAILED